jgi:hypothetical protein
VECPLMLLAPEVPSQVCFVAALAKRSTTGG